MSEKHILCVLLHGPSGSGKSQTAKEIAVPNGVVTSWKQNHTKVVMDHKFFAAPISEIHSIKIKTLGFKATDRQLWMIHEVLRDVFPPLSISFEDFIELIYDAQAWDLNWHNHDSEIIKDRDFMTDFADKCHHLMDNPFARTLVRSIKKDINKDYELGDNNLLYVPIISDLRLRRELNFIESQFDNIIKIKLDASLGKTNERLLNRDKKTLTNQQLLHETQVSPFEDHEFDLIVQSDEINLQAQIEVVRRFILDHVIQMETS